MLWTRNGCLEILLEICWKDKKITGQEDVTEGG
jgi:hypothetical protein